MVTPASLHCPLTSARRRSRGRCAGSRSRSRPRLRRPFTPLDRRQVLSPTPYALFSSFTDPANLTNLNASNLTSGVQPSGQLGEAHERALLTEPEQRVRGDGSGLTNLNPRPCTVAPSWSARWDQPPPTAPPSLAALAGIVVALRGKPVAAQDRARRLQRRRAREPRSCGRSSTIEGSGETVTKITGPWRRLDTVGHRPGREQQRAALPHRREHGREPSFARALYVGAGSPRIRNVTVLASGGTTETRDSSRTASDGRRHRPHRGGHGSCRGSTCGVLNVNASSTMTNVQSTATAAPRHGVLELLRAAPELGRP